MKKENHGNGSTPPFPQKEEEMDLADLWIRKTEQIGEWVNHYNKQLKDKTWKNQ